MNPLWLVLALLAMITLSLLSLLRLRTILNPRRGKPYRHNHKNDVKNTHLLIVLGSGGHTAEMTGMLQRALTESDDRLRLKWADFKQRTWVVSSGDSISAERAKRVELQAESKLATSESRPAATRPESYDIHTIPRARKIHQPLYTAPISSLQCMLSCFYILLGYATSRRDRARNDFPDIILCNGPATATIMIFASIILRFFDINGCHSRGKMRTIYVESWARVKKLSLSGFLLSHLVDRFLVQWPQLVKPGGRAEYIGVLV